MNKIHSTVIPFTRYEDGKLSTIALVKFTLTKKMTKDQILKALTTLLTQWVKDTDEGKKAWEYSGGDFNIGDLASYEGEFGEWIAHSKLTAKGIINFEYLENGDMDIESYDRVLMNADELEDIEI
jgi:hypothetical protein